MSWKSHKHSKNKKKLISVALPFLLLFIVGAVYLIGGKFVMENVVASSLKVVDYSIDQVNDGDFIKADFNLKTNIDSLLNIKIFDGENTIVWENEGQIHNKEFYLEKGNKYAVDIILSKNGKIVKLNDTIITNDFLKVKIE